MRATYVIFDGLSFTFAGVTSGATVDAAGTGALPSAAGAAAVSGLAACEHDPSAPADINAIPKTV